jgi:hypothetical protein
MQSCRPATLLRQSTVVSVPMCHGGSSIVCPTVLWLLRRASRLPQASGLPQGEQQQRPLSRSRPSIWALQPGTACLLSAHAVPMLHASNTDIDVGWLRSRAMDKLIERLQEILASVRVGRASPGGPGHVPSVEGRPETCRSATDAARNSCTQGCWIT